jgi:Domain of unknown function (DUF4396)
MSHHATHEHVDDQQDHGADHEHHGHHHHHEMPTEGRALTGVAVSATLHCLTGCALGEIAGMAIGTALGFSDLGTIALAVSLAFLFGYTLTSLPLLRAGLALGAVIPIALASDTLSIAVMEIVDNAVMVIVPGAMDAGLSDLLFWGALSFALAVAFAFAVPVNRWLISKGKGHVAVHETGIHGGPSPRLVGAVLTVATVFGVSVLVAEAISGDGGGHMDHGETTASERTAGDDAGHGAHGEHAHGAHHAHGGDAPAGLGIELDRDALPRGETTTLAFRVVGEDGKALTDFETEHERKMHLILVRRDLTGFQHLHPEMAADGTWSTPVALPEAGEYELFADFKADGESVTLDRSLHVDGPADYQELPPQRAEATTASGYDVRLDAEPAGAGEEATLSFHVSRDGEPVAVEPYLGANGHLVALREGDLEFLHVHPSGEGVEFATAFPSAGAYRLFLQFKHGGEVHTAEFTRRVGR